jgi:hexosaminidase
VKRHYGIRTPDFKLIHYYYDIDEWELFDLKNDPHEMNNLYNDPAYQKEIVRLKEKLTELREKYKDNNEKDFLPKQQKKIVKHRAVGAKVSLKYPCSAKYPGGSPYPLTDGKVSIIDLSQTKDYLEWQGFEEKDLIATIDLKKRTIINQISAGFLQNTDSWIFAPEWVEFEVSNDNKTFTVLDKVKSSISQKSQKEERISFDVELHGAKVRYVRVHAKNIGECPEWHKGASGKAWLFADEIIIN